MSDSDRVTDLADVLGLPHPDGRLLVEPTEDVFGSPYAVTEAAVASVATALWAVSVLDAHRRGADPEPVRLHGRHAAAAFHSERLLEVPALAGRPLWDPIAGSYATVDGWVRLHTNMASHRAAALAVLGVEEDRGQVAAAAAGWRAAELEDAVVAAGGVAAMLRTRAQWRTHPQAQALAGAPLLDVAETAEGPSLAAGRVLDGVRVLDLTRVIAGPVAGRFLASFGADVLRVDAPLDDELLLEIDTSFGKRRATLDLRRPADRERFDELLSGAHVLLQAFRPGALAALGYDDATLQRLRPGLVVGRLSAYGETGPWGDRRGFDSVVQVACGLAATCGLDPRTGPAALPAQALDHASGYLLAAGVVAGLLHARQTGRGVRVGAALARTADWLESLGTFPGRPARTLGRDAVEDLLGDRADTAWGVVRHVHPPGAVGGRRSGWVLPPADRQSHVPRWS